MSEKRKPGRPDTHLSESPFAIRMPATMLDQVRVAARREVIAVSEWLRRAIQERLSR